MKEFLLTTTPKSTLSKYGQEELTEKIEERLEELGKKYGFKVILEEINNKQNND